ncbi:hypothetical protein NP233_g825 [Leucocoprinus birnbaumii]|uniref:Cofilin n=1 Tax=Leucocoprinus birnbaumii TaxID=56174 RepID=A0AAD5W6C3_9AGAR|nr:hypothetical protein NP233_g825 [Leucocoprinus birnbaumii]
MSSGVEPAQACIDAFQELKLKKTSKYIIYSLSKDLTEIIVEKKSPSTDYEEFLESLPEDEPRYAVVDVEYELEGGAGKRSKIAFITWIPGLAKIKQRMVYASSKDALKKSLQGIQVEVQATDLDEAKRENIIEKLKRLR